MAVKISGGGRKAKAPNSAEKAFVPSGYLSLGDAVAAAGKAHFGNSWTGDEINYGFVDIESRKSDDYQSAILEIEVALFREETGFDVDEIEAALFREKAGFDVGEGIKRDDLPTIPDKDFRTIERRVEKKWAAIKEARQRFDHAVGWVQNRLWSGVIPATVLTTIGTINPIPRELWGSDDAPSIFETGKVEYHPGKYGEEWSPTAAPLRGSVLIRQEELRGAIIRDRASNRTEGGTIVAERECAQWIAELASEGHRPANKEAVKQKATDKWGQRLSHRSFERAWASAAPAEWRKPGKKRKG